MPYRRRSRKRVRRSRMHYRGKKRRSSAKKRLAGFVGYRL